MIHWKNTKNSSSARSHIIKVITTKMRSQTSAEFLGPRKEARVRYYFDTGSSVTSAMRCWGDC